MSAPVSLFDWMAEALERNSSLNRLEARGTIRVSLRGAGLDAASLTVAQLLPFIESALVRDLQGRGIAGAEEICRRMQRELKETARPAEAAVTAEAAGVPSPFEWVSSFLEEHTSLSRLQARGTVRMALKDAGLAPEQATKRQMEVVVAQLVAKHLRACGIPEPDSLCETMAESLAGAAVAEPSGADTPEDVFGRLGGD